MIKLLILCQWMCPGASEGGSGGQACVWQWCNQRCRVCFNHTATFSQAMLLIRGVLGIGLPKLSAVQGALLQRAKKYAMEVCDNTLTRLLMILVLQVSIKLVLMKQTMAHQQQQTKYLQRQQAVSIMSR